MEKQSNAALTQALARTQGGALLVTLGPMGADLHPTIEVQLWNTCREDMSNCGEVSKWTC